VQITPRKKKNRSMRMEGPNIVFESRISELEAHLTQMKIELKKAQEEASIYKSKLVSGDFSDRANNLDLEPLQRQVENLRRYFQALPKFYCWTEKKLAIYMVSTFSEKRTN
jgi:hypothetical protein